MTNPANPGKDTKMLNELFECNPAGFPEVEATVTDTQFDGYLSDEEIAEYLAGVEVAEIEFDEVLVADDFIEDVAASNAFLAKFMIEPIGEQMAFAF